MAILCANAGWVVAATKDESTGDFVITGREQVGMVKLKLEGASKKIKDADFVIRDDIDFPGVKTIPLWLLGMMY